MDIEKLITFLANTDEPFAKVQAELTYGQDILKHLKGAYVSGSELPVSKATEQFYASKHYTNHINKLHKLNVEQLTMKNKRKTAEMKIEIWRSMEASRRKTNV
jgi:uncharacterized C2H2 Zn-finger protein